MLKSHSQHTLGVVAVTLQALCYGLTAVVARYLSLNIGIFESWYLRYALGLAFAVVLLRGRVDYRKFLHLPRREWVVLIGRSLVGGVIAVALYALASQKAKIGPVAFMQVLPSTTLLGVVLFKESLGLKKGLLVLLAFAGAVFVALGSLSGLSSLNLGELYSLISGVLFSLMFVTRRLHTGVLNDIEITVGTLAIAALGNYILAVATGTHQWLPHIHWTLPLGVILVVASFMGVAVNFLLNYGFQRVSAVVAGNILNLELVFGPIFGYIFYREVLETRELIGGAVILAAVIAMNLVDRRERHGSRRAQIPVIAD
ncbi:MAG TPA: DMT family transporter [Candidatus Saccharimonadia bacterium]|nr:DMT family transporter [Candidatus Saccharimonadia bacterium]